MRPVLCREAGAGRRWRQGSYFRLLLIGYFEGIDSERGIAWRCADSLGAAVVPAVMRSTRLRRITRRSRGPGG